MTLPILTYSLEALALNKSELLALNHPWERSLEKVFHTFNKTIVKEYQPVYGLFPNPLVLLYEIAFIFKEF